MVAASEALGINAPFDSMGDGDSPECYLNDTLETGGGLGDPTLCQVLAEESAERVRELIALGVRFTEIDGHLERIPLSIANTLTALEPLFTLAFSRFLLGKQEKPTGLTLLGAAGTVSGALILTLL